MKLTCLRTTNDLLWVKHFSYETARLLEIVFKGLMLVVRINFGIKICRILQELFLFGTKIIFQGRLVMFFNLI